MSTPRAEMTTDNCTRYHSAENTVARDKRGAIVLCGGTSRRMGSPKHLLRFGEQTALERIVAQVRQVVGHTVIVKAAGQRTNTESWGERIIVANDRTPGCGPLEGWAAGWSQLPHSVTCAVACSCDLPLLTSPIVEALFRLLGDREALVPIEPQGIHPLCAAYSTNAVPIAEALLKQNRRRMTELIDRLSTKFVSVERLRDIDPNLDSFFNINTPSDYKAAIERASQQAARRGERSSR